MRKAKENLYKDGAQGFLNEPPRPIWQREICEQRSEMICCGNFNVPVVVAERKPAVGRVDAAEMISVIAR